MVAKRAATLEVAARFVLAERGTLKIIMPRDNEHKSYKEKWACFGCRKCFKQQMWAARVVDGKFSDVGRVLRCPQCRQPMSNMGWDFRVPKQTDAEQWEKTKLLIENGYNFQSYCYWNESHKGPGPRPARLRDVEQFLKAQKKN